MSVEVPVSVVENNPESWKVERTELPNGFKARFVGRNVTKDEQINELHRRVYETLRDAEVEEETCDNARLIASELGANAIEHGLGHVLTELDLLVLRQQGCATEVYISVINPTEDDTRIESNPSMSDEENHEATSGRGGIITDALTQGDWDWRVSQLRAEKDTPLPEQPSLIVYAHLGSAGLNATRNDHGSAA